MKKEEGEGGGKRNRRQGRTVRWRRQLKKWRQRKCDNLRNDGNSDLALARGARRLLVSEVVRGVRLPPRLIVQRVLLRRS